ncbi:putative arginine decarboxylase-like [Capsicum annuum]|nr:putative arginine decarboxylase-like [Capsicum annuum]
MTHLLESSSGSIAPGTIPKLLEKLSYLKSINVSFNDLEGEIPNGGVFANSTLQSFLGNKRLCGMNISEITACAITNTGKQSKSKKEYCHLNLLQRVTVMIDAAIAIEYLHHGNETLIVHCDLTPANVLLDEDMVAHVGDFGISKILAISKSMAHREALGTLGYIAPEYGLEGIVSTSGDVYSYGIMFMEVLTKRRPTDEEICNENLDLRKWITQSFSGTVLEVMDTNLFSEEEQITSKSEICVDSMIELPLDYTKETP